MCCPQRSSEDGQIIANFFDAIKLDVTVSKSDGLRNIAIARNGRNVMEMKTVG